MASNDTSFKPGQSGNPSGRKPDREMREMCRALSPRAIEALDRALDDPKTAVPAAVALLDRGWGKPAQAIVGGDEDSAPVRLSMKVNLVRSPHAGPADRPAGEG
jgi:Family of unknown function (DUF5681)